MNVFAFSRSPEQIITTYGPGGVILDGPRLFRNLAESMSGKRFPLVDSNNAASNFAPYSKTWDVEVEQTVARRLRLRASYLRRMFHLASEDGKLRDVPHFPMTKEAGARKGFFERDQYDQLMAELPDYLKLPVTIGFYTGMREGEILGLDWSQIDFLRSVICLREGETKNDEAREAPIVAQLRTLLEERHAKRRPDCPYVCYRIDRKGHAVKVESFRKAWYSSCVRCGLGKMEQATDDAGKLQYARPRGPHSKPKAKTVYQGMIFHDLRRTGVRNLVRAGVPEKVAMSISGHKTRSVFDRYNITSGKDISEAGKKLELFHSQKSFGDISGTMCTEMQQPVFVKN